MSWTSLATRLPSLPLVLAGPMLRQVTKSSVTVWVATQKKTDVTLTVYDSDAVPGRKMLGTAKGLSRSVRGASGKLFQLVNPQIPDLSNWPVTALLEDDFQSLWIGTGNGLYRRWPDAASCRSSQLMKGWLFDSP